MEDDRLPLVVNESQREEFKGVMNSEAMKMVGQLLNCVSGINALNEKLSGLSAEENPEEYNQAVREVLKATKTYYKFLGQLPPSTRNYIMDLSSAESTDPNAYGLQNLFSLKTSFDLTPLLSIQSVRPKNYIMHIDAIANRLASLGECSRLKVGRRGNQPVLTSVTLNVPQHMKIEGGGGLSTYDKSIINGVTSLLESGNDVFSVPMLYHAMTGRQNPTIDENLHEEICGKLEKMRRMMLSIDLSQEGEAGFLVNADGEQISVKDLKLEGYLLPINRLSGIVNGKKTEMYQILQPSPLYTYSKMRKQLASVRITLLSAPVNNNATTIPLKTYLLQRIELMKNQKNNIRRYTILYSSIYKELGASDAGKTRKMRIRSYTTTILEYFVDQLYIQSFDEYKDGRVIKGVRITI